MWQFSPTLETSAERFVLPRPVTALRISDRWRMDQFEVPLRDGDRVHGRSRRGVDVSIRGRLGRHDGALTASELAMFDVLEQMREACHADPEAKFGLAIFDDGTLKRGFSGCVVTRLEYDLSDASLFGYSLVVHASDPVLKTAGSLV